VTYQDTFVNVKLLQDTFRSMVETMSENNKLQENLEKKLSETNQKIAETNQKLSDFEESTHIAQVNLENKLFLVTRRQRTLSFLCVYF
jgi:phage shock protein A